VGTAIKTVNYHRWADGILVRNREMENERALFLLLYLHFLYGKAVNLHFENPLWECIYRTCLRREPIDRHVVPGNRLHYSDAEGLRLIPEPPIMDREDLGKIYEGLIAILGRALEYGIGDPAGPPAGNTAGKNIRGTA
jgi:hypothetical protein